MIISGFHAKISAFPEFLQKYGTHNMTCVDMQDIFLISTDVYIFQLLTINFDIISGGISMGGAMALHMGYRIYPNISGVFAMSSFLNTESSVYKVCHFKEPLIFVDNFDN